MKKHLFLLLISFASFLNAQKVKNPESAVLIQPSLGIQFAGGDMGDRFGQSLSAGLAVGYKTNKNWTWSLQGQYMFGTDVRNTNRLLNALTTNSGDILNQVGNYTSFSLSQRGAYGLAEVGKTTKWLAANPNSGIGFSMGAGYLIHWVEIDNAGNSIPQLEEEYRKGYDESSGGFMLKQSIGYTFLSPKKRINFKFSFELLEAFTTNYRKFDYSTGRPTSGTNFDLIYGFRLDWILPIYTGGSSQTFYYD